MKLRNFLFLIIAPAFFACEEIPPAVTGGSNTQRRVLIEEFTGVRCVQCPAGSALIEDLLAANGVQLIAVSIHSGIFSPPYNDSQFDFRTAEGDEILTFLGEPLGYPSAVVNRRHFDGEFDLQLGDGLWAGFIAEEKATPPKVNLGLVTTYDEAERQVKIDLKMDVQQTVPEEARLTIMFTESDIVDTQKVPGQSEPKTDYVHKHVLRGMATAATGDPIGQALTAGTILDKTYDFTLPDEWVAENCHVIAFVSLAGGSKDVLQAAEKAIIE